MRIDAADRRQLRDDDSAFADRRLGDLVAKEVPTRCENVQIQRQPERPEGAPGRPVPRSTDPGVRAVGRALAYD
jgi:hypothetical protein